MNAAAAGAEAIIGWQATRSGRIDPPTLRRPAAPLGYASGPSSAGRSTPLGVRSGRANMTVVTDCLRRSFGRWLRAGAAAAASSSAHVVQGLGAIGGSLVRRPRRRSATPFLLGQTIFGPRPPRSPSRMRSSGIRQGTSSRGNREGGPGGRSRVEFADCTIERWAYCQGRMRDRCDPPRAAPCVAARRPPGTGCVAGRNAFPVRPQARSMLEGERRSHATTSVDTVAVRRRLQAAKPPSAGWTP